MSLRLSRERSLMRSESRSGALLRRSYEDMGGTAPDPDLEVEVELELDLALDLELLREPLLLLLPPPLERP